MAAHFFLGTLTERSGNNSKCVYYTRNDCKLYMCTYNENNRHHGAHRIRIYKVMDGSPYVVWSLIQNYYQKIAKWVSWIRDSRAVCLGVHNLVALPPTALSRYSKRQTPCACAANAPAYSLTTAMFPSSLMKVLHSFIFAANKFSPGSLFIVRNVELRLAQRDLLLEVLNIGEYSPTHQRIRL